MIVIRPLIFSLVLLALVSSLLAFTLTVNVRDKDDTKLLNAKVQILVGSTVLYEKAADINGTSKFELAEGTYFIRLNRTFYPGHVVLYDLQKDDTVQVVMLKDRQTYILYGQVMDDPPSRWTGHNLSLLDGMGRVLRQSTIGKNGYYIVPYLDPSVTYQVRVEGEGGRLLSAPIRFNQAEAYYLPLDLRAQTLINDSPLLSAPGTAALYGRIEAVLRSGEKPVAGQSVEVHTPGGAFNVTSNDNGRVAVNAGAPGLYIFVWNNQTARTEVAALPSAQPPEEKPAKPETPAAPASGIVAPPAEPPKNDNGSMIGAGLGLLIVAGLALIAMVLVTALLGPKIYHALGGKMAETAGKAKTPPAAGHFAPPHGGPHKPKPTLRRKH